jgi:anti-sigma factor RsiW
VTRHLGARLSALIDGELSDTQRERVLAHLARCEDCRREAAALRLLKRRMHTLGDAAVGDALTWRLLALAPRGGEGPAARRGTWAGRGRGPARGRRPGPPMAPGRRRHAWSLAVAGVATAGLGLTAAVFLAGGRQPPGPTIVPAVDVFMVQHAITTGEVPVQPSDAPSRKVP